MVRTLDDRERSAVLQTMFGQYRIEALLGRGGMGEVYRAYDTNTGRDVALKLLSSHLAEDEEYQARFRRECAVAARLSEPHVVPIHHFGEIEGRLYLDMRLVEGTDLGAWLAEHGPMPPDVAVAVIGQVAQALDAAHADGLVHRDVKPSNILLSKVTTAEIDVASVFAYLFDFGIARAREGASAPDEVSLTKTGVVPGSAKYVAPERFENVEGDPRADVYALACVLHEALTGRPPFEGGFPALMRAHLFATPPKASQLQPGVPSGLDDVVAKGMAKDRTQRYSTAGELAKAARTVIGVTSGYFAVPALDTRKTINPRDATAPNPGGPVTRPPPRPDPGRATETRTVGPSRTPQPARFEPPRYGPPGNEQVVHEPPPVAAARVPSRLLWYGAAVFVVVTVASGLVLSNVGGIFANPPPAPPLTEDAKLLRALPPGFTAANCRPMPTLRAESAALSYVVCGDGPADGPISGQFARFGSRELLVQEFNRQTDKANVTTPQGKLADCPEGTTFRGVWSRATGSNTDTGSIVCLLSEATGGGKKVAYLLWTDNDALALGYVRRDDVNAAVLFDWWRTATFTPAG